MTYLKRWPRPVLRLEIKSNIRKGKVSMSVNNPKELFVALLSNVRQGTERAGKIYREFGQHASEPEIKEALEARAFVSDKVLGTLDECFKLIHEKPIPMPGRLQEVFVEDFRKELAE